MLSAFVLITIGSRNLNRDVSLASCSTVCKLFTYWYTNTSKNTYVMKRRKNTSHPTRRAIRLTRVTGITHKMKTVPKNICLQFWKALNNWADCNLSKETLRHEYAKWWAWQTMLKPRYETPTYSSADPNWHKLIAHDILSDPACAGLYFDKFEKHKSSFSASQWRT